MNTKLIAALFALASIALFSTAPSAQKKDAKSTKSEAFKAATCSCRAMRPTPDRWASCMRAKGFDVEPGAGSGVSC
jgi:hypothetical protein